MTDIMAMLRDGTSRLEDTLWDMGVQTYTDSILTNLMGMISAFYGERYRNAFATYFEGLTGIIRKRSEQFQDAKSDIEGMVGMDFPALFLTHMRGQANYKIGLRYKQKIRRDAEYSRVRYTDTFILSEDSSNRGAMLFETLRTVRHDDKGIPILIADNAQATKYAHVTCARPPGQIGKPQLYPLRHVEDIAEDESTTVMLIDDVNNRVYNIWGVHLVRGSSNTRHLTRFALNLEIVDDGAAITQRLERFSTVTRAIYNSLDGKKMTGVFIERDPLLDDVLICHFGDLTSLSRYLRDNVVRQYTSFISQSVRSEEQINYIPRGGARYPVNAKFGLLGSMAIMSGEWLHGRQLRKMEYLKDATDYLMTLGRDEVWRALGVYYLLSEHITALTYRFGNTMAERNVVGTPSAENVAFAHEIFLGHRESYANVEDGSVPLRNANSAIRDIFENWRRRMVNESDDPSKMQQSILRKALMNL
jgi:hypothetical protein